MSDDGPGLSRRSLLGAITGAGALSVLPGGGSAADWRTTGLETRIDDGSYHPGPPRFLQVGETLENPPFVGEHGQFGIRDNLGPRLPDPGADPENYDAGAFQWRLAEKPDDSDAELAFGVSVSGDLPRYTDGAENAADFAPDVPGRYTVELDAPDGTHEWTFHVFPDGTGSSPELALEAHLDGSEDEFVLETNARPAPDSDATKADLEVVFLADDRDPLDTDDIEQDGRGARVPLDALGEEPVRVHAAAFDGDARSMADTVELYPDGSTSLPNRPPEWVKDGVMYQIFPRSWAGEPGETTMADLRDGVEYLDDLGVDMVWLTPVVPAESVSKQFGGEYLAEEYDYLGDSLSGGGPHGYDTLDYFGVAPDLVPDGEDPIESYRSFVEACNDRDIRVIFDLVVSHCGRSHPFFQDTIAAQGDRPPHGDLAYPAVESWDGESKYFDWFDRVDVDDTYQGTDVEPAPHATGFFGLRHMPNLNYNNPALREHVLAVADFWSGEVGVDGFRCDIAWGVPKSFWQDVRSVVRGNDSEFLLLDETIPKDPRMGENAFDMHFDTEGFTVHSHDVAAGETSPGQLVDDVRTRANQGVPPYGLVLNLIENHDEHRLLNQAVVDLHDPDHDAISDEEWADGAHLQRVCWAMGVLLPGVPGIYYGQERQISRYGEGRHRGEGDPRGVTEDGGVDISPDVRPGGRQRAFVNWDTYPEDHLQFYSDLVDLYHDLDVLKPDARLRNAWGFSTEEVVVFGRDAGHLEDVDGPEQVLVAVNFETSPAEVELRPEVGSEELLTGERIEDGVETRPGTVVTFEDVLVLEAPTLFDVGDLVADFDPPEDTDHGPGSYEYPTGDALEDGAFDVTEFTINETRDAHQFRVGVAGEVTNPDELPEGFTHQHLQIYVRNPERADGTSAAREGVGATFEAPYQYRVVVDGQDGVRVESADGDVVATGAVTVNTVTNEFLIEVPSGTFGASIGAVELAPLVLGYDTDAPGNVRPVEADADAEVFGGADGEAAPNVIDTGLPSTFPNDEALSYGEGEQATVPFAAVVTEFQEIARFDLGTGSGYGPGDYEVPTGGDYYEEAWDIDDVTISESRDDVRVEFTMAAEPENPWGFGPGFSHPFFQLYLRVPGESPESLLGRTGTNVAFVAPYHYRVVVHGEGVQQIEDPAGGTVSRNVDVSLDGRTVAIEFPVADVGWDTDDTGVGIAPTVMPYDGFGEGGIRFIGEEAAEHTIGGGHSGGFDPAVMDMVVPEGVDRQAVLSDYGPEDPPQLPFVGLGPMDDVVEPQAEPEVGDGEDGGSDGRSESDGETGSGDESTGNGDGDGTTGDDGEAESADSEATEDGGDDTADGGGPGFGVAGAAGALGGLGYLLKRRVARNAVEKQNETDQ